MWQKGASAYSNTFARVTRQANNTLLDMAGVHMTVAAARHIVEKTALELNGEELRVLDVACGPGSLAQAAAERGAGEVVGVDFSSEMLVAAEPVASRFPGRVRFVEGDAADLPLDDSSFDAVVIGFGLLHLPHPQSALEEAFRVLKKGWQTGRATCAFLIESACAQVAKSPSPSGRLPRPGLPSARCSKLLPTTGTQTYSFQMSRASLPCPSSTLRTFPTREALSLPRASTSRAL